MGVHTQLEIERKYDVGEAASAPDLAVVPGVAQAVGMSPIELRADYFDTGGGTLGERRIILRRRVGGPDEGWHIKTTAAGGRMETHFPLGGQKATVPEAVLDTVRVHTRADPLRPVARVRTHRTVVRLLDGDGALLAEFCDDEVHARAVGGAEQTWREWEVELGPAGTADLLDGVEAVLLEAGAAPSAHVSKLRRVLDAAGPAAAARGAGPVAAAPAAGEPDAGGPSAAGVLAAALRAALETLKHWDPLVRRDADDAVHQMRIAARTLRSLLQTYADLFTPGACGPLEEGLRRLGRVLAGARDAEVVRDMVAPRCRAVPGGVPAAVAKGLRAGKEAERREDLARLRHRLSGATYFALLNDLDAFVEAPPLVPAAAGPAAELLEARVERGLAEVLALADRAAAAPDRKAEIELLHEVRKTAKRLRYAVKGVAVKGVPIEGAPVEAGAADAGAFDLGPGPAARMDVATAVQDALGTHRDSVMFQEYVRRSARQARKAGRDTFAHGVLYGAEFAVQERSLLEGEAALKRLR